MLKENDYEPLTDLTNRICNDQVDGNKTPNDYKLYYVYFCMEAFNVSTNFPLGIKEPSARDVAGQHFI